MKNNPAVQEFVNALDIQPRLDPSNSFFGVQCNTVTLYSKAKGKEKIKYVHFTSLYPTVNKYDRYPGGHLQVIYTNFKDICEYFGLAKIKILPPRDIYHPVLPYRANMKLMFPLCKTCADTENQNPCQCTNEA